MICSNQMQPTLFYFTFILQFSSIFSDMILKICLHMSVHIYVCFCVIILGHMCIYVTDMEIG